MRRNAVEAIAEKKAILDSFYGYTTWQEIKAMIPEVVFKGKHEID